MVRYGTVWYVTVRYGTVRYGTVRYGLSHAHKRRRHHTRHTPGDFWLVREKAEEEWCPRGREEVGEEEGEGQWCPVGRELVDIFANA